jgi:hypothetical protein
MNTIKVTVWSSIMPHCQREYICYGVDISDLNEVENCAAECVGKYLDNEPQWYATNATWDEIVDSCMYCIEEVFDDEL